jgi:hypothetical protein
MNMDARHRLLLHDRDHRGRVGPGVGVSGDSDFAAAASRVRIGRVGVIDVFVSDWVVVMRWEMRMRAVLTGTIGYLRVEEVVQAAMLTHRHFTTKRNVHVLNDDFGSNASDG